MSEKSIWGSQGKLGTVRDNGNGKFSAYDNRGTKLGEEDRFGVRDNHGSTIVSNSSRGGQSFLGSLFNRKNK